MKIRKATIKDLESIQKLNQLLFQKEHDNYDSLLNLNWAFDKEGREYFEKAVNNKDKVIFVAEKGNKIIGYLAGAVRVEPVYKNHALEAEVENTLVLEEYRCQGIGSELINVFISWARESGAKRVEVRASSGNVLGIKFYKKKGFEDFDTVLKIDL